MKFYKSILASTLLLTMSQGAFAQSNSSDELILQKTENLKLSTDKINDFVIEAGSGKLKVIASDVDSIEVVAEIYQRKAHNDYCLDLKKVGNKSLASHFIKIDTTAFDKNILDKDYTDNLKNRFSLLQNSITVHLGNLL